MTIDLNGSSRWAWFSHKIFKSFCLSFVEMTIDLNGSIHHLSCLNLPYFL
ncbi:hypothetical protein Hanom_Chr12g01177751 [Helianthus anomalus]